MFNKNMKNNMKFTLYLRGVKWVHFWHVEGERNRKRGFGLRI